LADLSALREAMINLPRFNKGDLSEAHFFKKRLLEIEDWECFKIQMHRCRELNESRELQMWGLTEEMEKNFEIHLMWLVTGFKTKRDSDSMVWTVENEEQARMGR